MREINAVTETPAELENLIKRILDVDSQARSITKKASDSRADAERDILNKKAALRDECIAKAKAEIDRMRAEEEAAADRAIEEARAEQDKLLAELEEKYKAGRDRWVNAIYKQIISTD